MDYSTAVPPPNTYDIERNKSEKKYFNKYENEDILERKVTLQSQEGLSHTSTQRKEGIQGLVVMK